MLRTAALAALLAASANARKFTGSISGDTNPYIAKFAFGVDKSGGNVGNLKITYSEPAGASAFLLEYDDDDWASVYPSKTCPQAVAAARKATYLDPAQPSQAHGFTETERPHYWFFTMAADQTCTPNGVKLNSYTLELTQADGNQLSYDEIGMPAIYGCFWAIYMLMLLGHLYAHYYKKPRFAPAVVIWFTVSLGLLTASLFCHMCDWATLQSNGVGAPAMGVIGSILRLISLMTLWVVCALVAVGYGVTTYKVDEKGWNWVGGLLLVALTCGYLTLAIYFAIDIDPKVVVSFGSLWPAITLLCTTIVYALWWGWKLRATYKAEVNTSKKHFLWRMFFALGANFAILPLAQFIGAVTPAYERARIVVGFDIFFITIVNAATLYVLLPSQAADVFRVFDGSAASSILGLGLAETLTESGGDFHAALDEAYAYTSVSESAGAGGRAVDYEYRGPL